MLWMLSALLLVLWISVMVSGAAGMWTHAILIIAGLAVLMSLMHRDRYDTF
jgi:hypothetical protein